MFASVDSPGNRELRAYLVTDEADIEIPIHFNFLIDEGDLMDDVTLARTVPTESNLRLVSRQLAEFSWYMNDLETKLPLVIQTAREIQGLDEGDRVVLTASLLRDVEDRLNGVVDESVEPEGEEAEKFDPETPLIAEKPQADREDIRIDPPRGFAAGMLEKITADIQEAIEEGKAEEENLAEFQQGHRIENRLDFDEVRVELWKGEFEGTTATYTFRFYKQTLAAAAGENIEICEDCQP